ncbi:MAG: hypothetical protein QNK31_10840 [Porticoccus sp.]|nr:hypothetical protein [Porticoccus sp.]
MAKLVWQTASKPPQSRLYVSYSNFLFAPQGEWRHDKEIPIYSTRVDYPMVDQRRVAATKQMLLVITRKSRGINSCMLKLTI